MNTLREAVGEYLEMRRGLGFKLQEAGKGLIDFITFLEQHNASYITQELALTRVLKEGAQGSGQELRSFLVQPQRLTLYKSHDVTGAQMR